MLIGDSPDSPDRVACKPIDSSNPTLREPQATTEGEVQPQFHLRGPTKTRWSCPSGRCGRDEGILIHELAHTVVIREYGRHSDIEAHGWQFCAVYLKLVRAMMGREARDILKRAMISNGVKFSLPRKKRLSSRLA